MYMFIPPQRYTADVMDTCGWGQLLFSTTSMFLHGCWQLGTFNCHFVCTNAQFGHNNVIQIIPLPSPYIRNIRKLLWLKVVWYLQTIRHVQPIRRSGMNVKADHSYFKKIPHTIPHIPLWLMHVIYYTQKYIYAYIYMLSWFYRHIRRGFLCLIV